MAADDLILTLRLRLGSPESIRREPFALAKDLARLINAYGSDPRVHELVIRACEFRESFGDAQSVLDALIRERGLFPYLNVENLDFLDAVAYESHRPQGLDNTVFHRVQADVYHRLRSGYNVVLSAPTSFGKSLIIDAVISSGKYNHIVIVVPTIALIDETRRRLFGKFRSEYSLITHVGQNRGARNIYILTQERVVQFTDLDEVDFFAIDEFYKLDPRHDEERSGTLNEALYRLYSGRAQFFLLGPNIERIPSAFLERFPSTFIRTDYATVASETHLYPTARDERLDKMVELFRTTIHGPTLVYCSSPESARHVAAALVNGGTGSLRDDLEPAASWAGEQYHRDWGFVQALRHGIGVHHGKMPRALNQFVVRAFDSGALSILVCTSTLIEGVNTKARNVVVYDNRIAQRYLDFFEFRNITGRSGRMLRHYVGHVYLFADPPTEVSSPIDVPLVTQTETAPDSLLIQLRDADLTQASRERIRPILEQSELPVSILRENRGVDPWAQIQVAKRIRADPEGYWPLLSWTRVPTSEQLYIASEIIWDDLAGQHGRSHGASSGRQLAYKIDRLRAVMDIRALIQTDIDEQQGEADPDRAVEDTLDFLNYWATYHFPRYLMSLSRIQAAVFTEFNLPVGDYSAFATQVENLFVPPGIAALDEYGVPIQIGLKLLAELRGGLDLDTTLSRLRRLRVERTALSSFERELIRDAQSYI